MDLVCTKSPFLLYPTLVHLLKRRLTEELKCFLQSEKSWDPRSDLIPSLYVFECVELELALKLASGEEEEPVESDFSCPIKLHRGRAVVQQQ